MVGDHIIIYLRAIQHLGLVQQHLGDAQQRNEPKLKREILVAMKYSGVNTTYCQVFVLSKSSLRL